MTDNSLQVDPSCDDDYDVASLDYDEAIRRILASVKAIPDEEIVPVHDSFERILAKPILSKINVPGHTNSAVDGYAISSSALPADGTNTLPIIGTAFAGKPYTGRFDKSGAVRIMTGAVVPEGADLVIMQEHATSREAHVTFDNRTKKGDNVRAAGEDIKSGEQVLAAGTRVGPSELGLIASLGIAEVAVKRQITVAFVSTGDELKGVGQKLAPGEIYDSNRYTLFGMLKRLNVDIIDLGVVVDDRDAVRNALSEAAARADMVITSGGVSVGEADYIKEILQELGEVKFWKVAMKPGRPLAFGKIGDAFFFGLPGNPVSVMVTFYKFVQPALMKLMGGTSQDFITVKARAANQLKKRPGRMEFQRGYLTTDSEGNLLVSTDKDQGSGILSSMSRANCFIVLPIDSGRVEEGEWVLVQPFHGVI
ncbi:MAG: molybdopterin molybdotransferase MoeA [Gammaproteobacteria bacterium]